MKIDTKKPLRYFTGEEIKDGAGKVLTVGDTLSNIVLVSKEGGKMKMFELARRLSGEKAVELDAADFQLIKHAVETTEEYRTAIVTGQLLCILSEIKEAKEEK